MSEYFDCVKKEDVEEATPAVAFIYEILRDGIRTPGDVEGALMRSQSASYRLSNPWLAGYARNIVNRIKKMDTLIGNEDSV